jgi:two-component system cell cycle sensor histidine kinase/response regulator CckA
VSQQGLWPVTVDPRRAEQILMNLAVNARDAMPTGGKFTIAVENTVLAEPTVQLPAGNYVSIRVTDTGCGVPPGDLSRIFDPFYTTKEVGKGTGLGLATCSGIVRQSDGDITVKSEVGVGTTFTIMLPRAKETAVVTPDPQARKLAPLKGTETIVVVEDEPAVLRSTSRILRDAGYTVIETGNGVIAREAIAREPRIDLVLTDVMMPKMGGKDLVKHLAKDHPRLKVLFMTGYSNDPAINESADRHILFKPFRSLELLTKIREVLDIDKIPAAA